MAIAGEAHFIPDVRGQLIERMRYKGIAERVLAKLNTGFVDER